MIVAPTLSTGHNSKPPPRFRATGAVTKPSGSLGTIDLTSQASSIASPRAEQGGVSIVAELYALAAELAQPVARGYLTRTEALSTLLFRTLASDRANQINRLEPTDVFRLQRHLFFQHLARLETRRAITESRIKNRIWPLMKQRQPRNVVLAEAHDVNGADGFPFDEPDITTIAAREMHFAGRQRRG